MNIISSEIFGGLHPKSYVNQLFPQNFQFVSVEFPTSFPSQKFAWMCDISRLRKAQIRKRRRRRRRLLLRRTRRVVMEGAYAFASNYKAAYARELQFSLETYTTLRWDACAKPIDDSDAV